MVAILTEQQKRIEETLKRWESPLLAPQIDLFAPDEERAGQSRAALPAAPPRTTSTSSSRLEPDAHPRELRREGPSACGARRHRLPLAESR
jgi:hypothetical protein